MQNEWLPCWAEFAQNIGSLKSVAMNPSITSSGMLSSNGKLCVRLLPATMKLSAFQELLEEEGIYCPKHYKIIYFVQGNMLYT